MVLFITSNSLQSWTDYETMGPQAQSCKMLHIPSVEKQDTQTGRDKQMTLWLFCVSLWLFCVLCFSLSPFEAFAPFCDLIASLTAPSYRGFGLGTVGLYPVDLLSNPSMILISQLPISSWLFCLRLRAAEEERGGGRGGGDEENRMTKGKEGKEDEEEKLNKLSGCNNVLPPDKLLANPATLTLPAHNPCLQPWQRFPSATGPPGNSAPSPWEQQARQIEDIESWMM